MANRLQLRKGNTTENNAFTGANGELTYDTQKKQLRVHDGSTVGGKVLADTSTLASTTTTGLVKLNNTLTSSSTTEAPTSLQVKLLNDKFTQEFTNNKATNGWQKLPNGLIIQWGLTNTSATAGTVPYPVTFPNATLFAVISETKSSTDGNIYSFSWIRDATTTSVLGWQSNGNAGLLSWFAIGH